MTRISRLRALIEHPATGADERAAAQRMLDRIVAKSGPVSAGDRSYGARYGRVGRHVDLERIAELLREDIAFVRIVFADPAGESGEPGAAALVDAIRDAPAEITYSVVGLPQENSIVITIEGVPAEWGGSDGLDSVSPALRGLADALVELLNSYNHDGESIGKRFFARVRAGHETLVW